MSDGTDRQSTLKHMFVFAVTADVIQAILGALLVGILVNTIVTIIVAIIFFLWISMKGMMTPEISIMLMKSAGGEAIPVANILPAWSRLFWKLKQEELKKSLGPLGAVIPGSKGGVGSTSTSTTTNAKRDENGKFVRDKDGKQVMNAPHHEEVRNIGGRRTVTINGKVVSDEERF